MQKRVTIARVVNMITENSQKR